MWAFTNLEDVAYLYAASREGDLVDSLRRISKGDGPISTPPMTP